MGHSRSTQSILEKIPASPTQILKVSGQYVDKIYTHRVSLKSSELNIRVGHETRGVAKFSVL